MLQVGVVFPQTEITADPKAVEAYAVAVEEMGFDYILAFDHVLGADTTNRPDWKPLRGGPPAYTLHSMFHEPFVLFGYLAHVTKRVELVTGVIILAQRQAVLVAKQAAEVDVLSGGRMRLGIGTGWNHFEYDALDMNWRDRGKRSEEQVEVMRELWTKETVSYKGKWHTIPEMGLNPMPVQRPIPVWFGGRSDPLLDRVGRIGDGWFPNMGPKQVAEGMKKVRAAAERAGRNPNSIGLETSEAIINQSPEEAAGRGQLWKEIGLTHLALNTMGAGLEGVDAHLDALRRFKEALEPW